MGFNSGFKGLRFGNVRKILYSGGIGAKGKGRRQIPLCTIVLCTVCYPEFARQHTICHEDLQLKRKIVSVHTTKAYRGRRSIGSFILNLATR